MRAWKTGHFWTNVLYQKHITSKRITLSQCWGFGGTNQNLLPNMELLISEIVARVLYRKTCFCDVNDAVQKKFTVLRGNIWRKTEYRINPQMTRTELGSRLPMTCREKEAISKSWYFNNGFLWPLAQISFTKSFNIYLE